MSLFGGSKRFDMPADPTAEAWQNELFHRNAGMGPAARWEKQYIKRRNAGGEVGEEGRFAPIMAQGATERRQITENAGQGANALVAQNGGENANIVQAQINKDLNASRENEGVNVSNAANEAYQNAIGVVDNAYGRKQELNQQAMLGALGNRLGYLAYRHQLGQGSNIFHGISELLGGAGQAAGGFAAAGV